MLSYEDGYREDRGYHERGNVSKEERFKDRKRR
jgi:DMSO/TMAO reductase YedYZ molybdopterin-dependent catalytic subunit